MIDKVSYILSKFPEKAPNNKGVIHTHCPFHDDSRPSFSIDVEEGLFYCGSTACGLRGGFALFYKLMEGLVDWKQVFEDLRQVTSNYSLDDLFSDSKQVKKEPIINTFPSSESLEPIGSIEYLEERGISSETVDAYGLQYGKVGVYDEVSVQGSIVAPVWDVDFTYKTFQLRYLCPYWGLRWINPSGSPIQDLLYGGWLVCPEDKELWIVEGASDVWNLYELGVKAVGLNTKEASPSQMNKLVKLCKYFEMQPIVMLDGDASIPKGQKEIVCSEKLFDELSASGLNPGIVKLEYEEDPGGLSYERFCEIKGEIRE